MKNQTNQIFNIVFLITMFLFNCSNEDNGSTNNSSGFGEYLSSSSAQILYSSAKVLSSSSTQISYSSSKAQCENDCNIKYPPPSDYELNQAEQKVLASCGGSPLSCTKAAEDSKKKLIETQQANLNVCKSSCNGNKLSSSSKASSSSVASIPKSSSSAARSSSSSVSSSSVVLSSSSADGCAYKAFWCNGSPTSANFVSQTPPTIENDTGNKCFYVKDVSKMLIAITGIINGVTLSSNNGNGEFVCGQWDFSSCTILLPAKQDGGYYIWTGDWISSDYSQFTTGSPSCGL